MSDIDFIYEVWVKPSPDTSFTRLAIFSRSTTGYSEWPKCVQHVVHAMGQVVPLHHRPPASSEVMQRSLGM